MPIDSTRRPNSRGDNPYDDDAVDWLLLQPGVAREFTRVQLFECARRQRRLLKAKPERVEQAAALCKRYGVQQIPVFDARMGKSIWRLRRTDPGAPADYPDYDAMRDSRPGTADLPPVDSPTGRPDALRTRPRPERPGARASSSGRSLQKTRRQVPFDENPA